MNMITKNCMMIIAKEFQILNNVNDKEQRAILCFSTG